METMRIFYSYSNPSLDHFFTLSIVAEAISQSIEPDNMPHRVSVHVMPILTLVSGEENCSKMACPSIFWEALEQAFLKRSRISSFHLTTTTDKFEKLNFGGFVNFISSATAWLRVPMLGNINF